MGMENNPCSGSVTVARSADVGLDNKICENSKKFSVVFQSVRNILGVKITENISYPEACKHVESIIAFIGMSHSSLLKQSSKFFSQ